MPFATIQEAVEEFRATLSGLERSFLDRQMRHGGEPTTGPASARHRQLKQRVLRKLLAFLRGG